MGGPPPCVRIFPNPLRFIFLIITILTNSRQTIFLAARKMEFNWTSSHSLRHVDGSRLKVICFLSFFYRLDEQLKAMMLKCFCCVVVFVLVVMVDQTEGWRRRRRRRCYAQSCAVSSWSWWSSCSQSCGWGRRIRYRTLTRQSTCGRGCYYSLSGSQNCNTHPCPGEKGAISARHCPFTLKTVYDFFFLGLVSICKWRSEQKHSNKRKGKINEVLDISAFSLSSKRFALGTRVDIPVLLNC